MSTNTYAKAKLSDRGIGFRQIDLTQDYSGCIFIRHANDVKAMNILVKRAFGEEYEGAQGQYKSFTTMIQSVRPHRSFMKDGRALPKYRIKAYGKTNNTTMMGGASMFIGN